METRKIAVACFIGGALCCAVALMFAPSYWWLGFIAGLAGGYISYDFREVWKTIPIAFLRALGRSAKAWKNMVVWAKAWSSRPHPFFWFGAFLALPLILMWWTPTFSPELVTSRGMAILGIFLFIAGYCEMVLVLGFLSYLLALIGAKIVERCFWHEARREGDYREVPLTYANAARWAVEGIYVVMKFFLWDMWRYLLRFVWYLYKLVHSKKRVLCAIYGTLGGVMAYIWLAPASVSFAQRALLVIFGGLLGAAIGVAIWEIVSKKILHVPVNGMA